MGMECWEAGKAIDNPKAMVDGTHPVYTEIRGHQYLAQIVDETVGHGNFDSRCCRLMFFYTAHDHGVM